MSVFATLQKRISKLTGAQVDKLAELSGVSATTITRIRYNSETKPRLENVDALLLHVDAAEQSPKRRPRSAKQVAA